MTRQAYFSHFCISSHFCSSMASPLYPPCFKSTHPKPFSPPVFFPCPRPTLPSSFPSFHEYVYRSCRTSQIYLRLGKRPQSTTESRNLHPSACRNCGAVEPRAIVPLNLANTGLPDGNCLVPNSINEGYGDGEGVSLAPPAYRAPPPATFRLCSGTLEIRQYQKRTLYRCYFLSSTAPSCYDLLN